MAKESIQVRLQLLLKEKTTIEKGSELANEDSSESSVRASNLKARDMCYKHLQTRKLRCEVN